jgi:hypothetical protein
MQDNMSLRINQLTILVALILSTVSAYFSVAGMAILFSGAALSVMVMASALELAKIMATVWLHHNWKTVPTLIRFYLCGALCVLILTTSMGAFGYLSRAHIEQSSSSTDYTLQIDTLESKLKNQELTLEASRNRVQALNDILAQANDKDRAYLNTRQKSERTQLESSIQEAVSDIEKTNQELLPLRRSNNIIQSDIGPIKYVAELFYGEDEAKKHFDEAVRLIIFFIVLVFDPLAIVLLVSGSYGLSRHKSIKPKPVPPQKSKKKMVEVAANNILSFLN